MKDRGTCITAAMKKDRTSGDKNKYYWLWREEKKKRHEAEGELTIFKGIETNRVKEAQARSNQLQDELDRVKLENNNLFTRVADSLEVNEHHQELNGKLQSRITEVEEDNRKLANQIEDQVRRARKAGM